MLYSSRSKGRIVFCQYNKALTETEESKRGGKNTQKNFTKKILNDINNHDAVVTHLEIDILKCEVKWALGSITTNEASGSDGIPAKLFQILKDDAVKGAALYMPRNLENSVEAAGLEKDIFHFNTIEGQCQRTFKLLPIALISHASKAMFRILQDRLQQYIN